MKYILSDARFSVACFLRQHYIVKLKIFMWHHQPFSNRIVGGWTFYIWTDVLNEIIFIKEITCFFNLIHGGTFWAIMLLIRNFYHCSINRQIICEARKVNYPLPTMFFIRKSLKERNSVWSIDMWFAIVAQSRIKYWFAV